MNLPFVPWPKIARLNRDIVITEKIDGTNAQIYVDDDGRCHAGSRNRWITPDDDNFGFARWVKDNEVELSVGLGPGTHYGEWWGAGIQRRYGLDEKRFSLFNVARWRDPTVRPVCCGVVPILYEGIFCEVAIKGSITDLKLTGSVAAPGFMKPEGIVIFHTACSSSFKVTCEGDESRKGQQ